MAVKWSPSPEHFKTIVKALKSVTAEGTFNITADGITFEAFNASHTCFVKYRLADTFSETATITVNLDLLLKTLQRLGTTLLLEYDGGDGKLTITHRGADWFKTFTIPSLETTSETYNIPQIQHTAEAVLKIQEFLAAIKDASFASPDLKITLNNGVVGVNSSDISLNYVGEFKAEGSGTATAYFRAREIEEIMHACVGLADKITIQLANSKPLKLSVHLTDGETLEYLIAPILR